MMGAGSFSGEYQKLLVLHITEILTVKRNFVKIIIVIKQQFRAESDFCPELFIMSFI